MADAAIKEAIATVVEVNTPPSVTPTDAKIIAAQTLATIKNDPVLANATGQEKWWQSGVGLFGTGGVLWSLGWILNAIATNGTDISKYDMQTAITAIGSLVGFGGVLYRRYVPGLKPFFWRWGQ